MGVLGQGDHDGDMNLICHHPIPRANILACSIFGF